MGNCVITVTRMESLRGQFDEESELMLMGAVVVCGENNSELGGTDLCAGP